MKRTSSWRAPPAATMLVLGVLASCCSWRTATGQPAVRYPPLDKVKLKKQGRCFTVTHTFADWFATDEVPLLDPQAGEFELVDRHSGSLVPSSCTATSVLVSTDSTPVDLGTFRKERWAAQALRLQQGKVVVDFALLEASLAATVAPKKNDRSDEAAFMMYFRCPKDAPDLPVVSKGFGSDGKRAPKNTTRTEYSVAMRYAPPCCLSQASTPFEALYQAATSVSMLNFTNDAAFWQEAPANIPFYQSILHRPACPRINFLGVGYCPALAYIQKQIFSDKNTLPNCKYNYPSAVQPNIDQSQTVGTDKQGNTLPGPFANLLAGPGGRLPDVVPQPTTDAESATLWWLYDKTVQPGLYAPCTGGGSVPFASASTFAPGFGPPTLHYISEPDEPAGSNYTHTPLAWTASGLDRDGNLTTVVAIRGTFSQSEWATNLQYNQRVISADDPPVLAPWVGFQIHYGYSLLLEQIYGAIKANVSAAAPQRIIVTGHSLGGGMATLISYGLSKDFPSVPVDAALFAPPSVGSNAFADAFNRRVNARRIAFSPTLLLPSRFLSSGDPVAQVLCPSHPQCSFSDPSLVSTMAKNSLEFTVNYRAVAGSVFFGYNDMPDAAYPGVPADTIRRTYKNKDINAKITFTHVCAYNCYFSRNVNATLNRCYSQVDADKYSGIPTLVKQYGLCVEPPTKLEGNLIFGVDSVWYGP